MLVIDYTSVTEFSANSLTGTIMEYISLGWQPFGSPSIMNGCFSQAMVRYEKEYTTI